MMTTFATLFVMALGKYALIPTSCKCGSQWQFDDGSCGVCPVTAAVAQEALPNGQLCKLCMLASKPGQIPMTTDTDCSTLTCGATCIRDGDMAGMCNASGECSFEYNALGCDGDPTIADESMDDSMLKMCPNAMEMKRQTEGWTKINGEVPPGKPSLYIGGTKVKMHSMKNQNGDHMIMFRGNRKSQTRMGIHFHKYGGYTIVLKGELTAFVQDEEPKTYGPNEVLYMPACVPMVTANVGELEVDEIDVFYGQATGDYIQVHEPNWAYGRKGTLKNFAMVDSMPHHINDHECKINDDFAHKGESLGSFDMVKECSDEIVKNQKCNKHMFVFKAGKAGGCYCFKNRMAKLNDCKIYAVTGYNTYKLSDPIMGMKPMKDSSGADEGDSSDNASDTSGFPPTGSESEQTALSL